MRSSHRTGTSAKRSRQRTTYWRSTCIRTRSVDVSTISLLTTNHHRRTTLTSTQALHQSKKQYALFIGRWQPWHDGHDWLIRQKLDKGVPVLVAVRDMEPDEANPYQAIEVLVNIYQRYADEDVEVIIIPDIESVNYGRGVGYEINEHVPPPDIHEISATKIRAGGEGE